LGRLDPARLDAAIALASIPENIRGYGPVKQRSIALAEARRRELMAKFDQDKTATDQMA
jgi:indolepyruvate ferredoxin oxidoreductase